MALAYMSILLLLSISCRNPHLVGEYHFLRRFPDGKQEIKLNLLRSGKFEFNGMALGNTSIDYIRYSGSWKTNNDTIVLKRKIPKSGDSHQFNTYWVYEKLYIDSTFLVPLFKPMDKSQYLKSEIKLHKHKTE